VSKLTRARARLLPLPAADLGQLRERVRALLENRPGVYRMVDNTGRVLYVGKAKRLRTRVLSYFRASYPEDKAARILYAAHDIRWEYAPSEFAAYLTELRQIRKLRPHFNYKLNRTRGRCSSRCPAVRRPASPPEAPSDRRTSAATDRFPRSAGRSRRCGR
jgi:Nuclease subunit of the excinuclease complex